MILNMAKKKEKKTCDGYPAELKKMKNKRISKEMRDGWRKWLISLRKLPVTAALLWSCYVTAKKRAIVPYLQ